MYNTAFRSAWLSVDFLREMKRFHTAGLIVAFLVFLVGTFFLVGPNDVRALGSALIVAAAIFAGRVVIAASLGLGRTGGSR